MQNLQNHINSWKICSNRGHSMNRHSCCWKLMSGELSSQFSFQTYNLTISVFLNMCFQYLQLIGISSNLPTLFFLLYHSIQQSFRYKLYIIRMLFFKLNKMQSFWISKTYLLYFYNYIYNCCAACSFFVFPIKLIADPALKKST